MTMNARSRRTEAPIARTIAVGSLKGLNHSELEALRLCLALSSMAAGASSRHAFFTPIAIAGVDQEVLRRASRKAVGNVLAGMVPWALQQLIAQDHAS